ncbi:hypothetical protein [Gelria sp. Kuro-4]|uniref:hypothetical protein n=1 Tax=Gelria sp. Kuro-4 TaxID=2796927 RepID=UPI001BEF389A|nr:hypothetical protein [Gelria sp. Kuro-4]BCV23260.1 hypothetical protein kuro4_00330 [Gelria sp. Kuro-4]
MYQLKVGEPFSVRLPSGEEKVYFELAEGGGFYWIVGLPKMTESEIEVLKRKPIKFYTIQEQGFVYLLARIGYMEFELHFNPALYAYAPDRLAFLTKSNMVTLVGVDSETNIVRVLRYFNLPLRLWDKLQASWQVVLREGGKVYDDWVETLRSFSLDDLYRRAEYVGRGGED